MVSSDHQETPRRDLRQASSRLTVDSGFSAAGLTYLTFGPQGRWAGVEGRASRRCWIEVGVLARDSVDATPWLDDCPIPLGWQGAL